MICKNCNGKGEVLNLTFGQDGGSCKYIKCTECGGTGIVGMTNEEWFCSLPTENKAEVLANKCRHAYVNYVPSKGTASNQEWWEAWLKEVHTNG